MSRANDAGLLALYQSVHLNRHFVGIIAQSLADVNVMSNINYSPDISD